MNGYKKYVYMTTVLLSSIQTALFYQTALAAAITSKITVNRVFDTGGSVIYRFTPVARMPRRPREAERRGIRFQSPAQKQMYKPSC